MEHLNFDNYPELYLSFCIHVGGFRHNPPFYRWSDVSEDFSRFNLKNPDGTITTHILSEEGKDTLKQLYTIFGSEELIFPPSVGSFYFPTPYYKEFNGNEYHVFERCIKDPDTQELKIDTIVAFNLTTATDCNQ